MQPTVLRTDVVAQKDDATGYSKEVSNELRECGEECTDLWQMICFEFSCWLEQAKACSANSMPQSHSSMLPGEAPGL
jgi:hypothetical protein